MKIYLAGPMRGYPEFNFPAFHAAAAKLREEGHEVFSPAETDITRHGTDISKGNANGDEDLAAKQHGFDLRVALGADLAWICSQAEAIALLPGWQASKGASAERAAAVALGLKVIELEGPTAKTITGEATRLVSGDRARTHGDKTQNHTNIAILWSGYLGTPVTAMQVAVMMVLLKAARTKSGAFNLDDFVDMAGYAGVAGEIAHLAEKNYQALCGTG